MLMRRFREDYQRWDGTPGTPTTVMSLKTRFLQPQTKLSIWSSRMSRTNTRTVCITVHIHDLEAVDLT